MQKVFLSSPPTARAQPLKVSFMANGSGAYPRDLRTMYGLSFTKSITESSQRRRIFRLWERMRSQRSPSSFRALSSSLQIGAPEAFPLVMTRASGMEIPSS